MLKLKISVIRIISGQQIPGFCFLPRMNTDTTDNAQIKNRPLTEDIYQQ
jgi:hypothetical protein